MAQGDITMFQEFSADIGLAIHNLSTGTVMCMLVDNSNAPTAAEATPRYSDWSGANGEVTDAGTYVDKGLDIANTWSQTGGTATFDGATNPSWAQDASNATDAYWAILFNDTATNDEAICYVDLGGPIDMTAGALTITWNASGIFTLG